MHKTFLAAAVALLCNAACTNLPERIGRGVDQADEKASRLVRDVGAPAQGIIDKPVPAAVHEDGIWLGKKIVKLSEPALPRLFSEPATFDRSVNSLAEVAERLTLRSGLPTKISPDALGVLAGGAPRAAGAAAAPDQAGRPAASGVGGNGARQDTPIRLTYANGTFKGLLDTIAARFGVYWKYANGSIQFFLTDSRTFQINAVPGDSSFSATVASSATSTNGSAGSGGGSGGGSAGSGGGLSANNNQNTSVASQLSVYSGIEKSILAMLSPYGKTVASPATGSITVVDTPDSLERIAAFIENENKTLARQVVINVTVLAVTLSNDDEYGINWNLVYSGLRNRFGVQNTFSTAPGSSSFSAGILSTSGSSLAGSTLIINALSEQGKVRRHTSASVVTLNNQPVPLQVSRQTTYLQSSQTTITAQVGATTTLTPGTINSGFNMSILPHMLDNGKVLLQFSTDISALRAIRTVSSNNSSIETPEIDTRNFLQRVAMKSNETLIISGFEQTDENLDRRGVGHPANFALGGGYKAGSSKEIIVILITPSTMAGS